MNEQSVRPDYRGCFGDRRRANRAGSVFDQLVEKRSAIINQTSATRADLVGASRFFNNPEVSESELEGASARRCGALCSGRRVLAIQDTTELNYQKHRGQLKEADPLLGPVGNNEDIGFFLHPMLVVDREDGFALGFARIHRWNRHWDKRDKKERNYPTQALEEKESYRWIESAQRAKSVLSEAQVVTLIADREGDLYEEFTRLPDERTEVLIRSRNDRRVIDARHRLLYELLEDRPCQGSYRFEVGHGNKKRRHRPVLMEVRFSQVELKRPKYVDRREPASVKVYAVEARESAETAVAGEPELVWRLLSTRVIETFTQAQELIRDYSLRWMIEELFRTLKSEGVNLEASQLRTGAALRRLAMMSLNVALTVMQLVSARDNHVSRPARWVFSDAEVACLAQLCVRLEGKTAKQQNPFASETLAWAAWIIGRAGGWKGYRKAGPAGPISMKRGLVQFTTLFQGWLLFQAGDALDNG